MTKQHNATLDGLRGVAALVVCLSHMCLALSTDYPKHSPFSANLSVDFFFLLSGFVIARAYEARLRQGMPVRRFMLLRVIRLWPLIVLGTLLGAIAAMGNHSEPVLLALTVSGLLLVPFSVHGLVFFPLDNPLWSLFYEVWANALYAVIARFRWMPVLLAALGAVLLAYITWRGHHISGGATANTLAVGVGQILWSFFAGILMHRIITPSRAARLPGAPFWALAPALFVLLINYNFGPWYDDLCVFIAFPAVLTLGLKDIAVGRARDAALLSGALSYPLYALHMPFVSQIKGFHDGRVPSMALMLVIVLAVSYAAWRLYDEPVRAWLTRASRRQERPAVAASATAGG